MNDAHIPEKMTPEALYWVKITNWEELLPKSLLDNQPPYWLEISQDGSGFFLFTLNAARTHCGDTWHQTLEDAYNQATYMYDIQVDDWRPY